VTTKPAPTVTFPNLKLSLTFKMK